VVRSLYKIDKRQGARKEQGNGKEGKKRQAPLTVVAVVLRRERERDVHTNRIEQRREVPDEPDGMYFFPLFFVWGEKLKGESVEGIC
jgi:hypothetical protein